MSSKVAQLLSEFRTIVGTDHVLTDADLTAGYCTDWTNRFSGATNAVIRPRATTEVAEIVRACNTHGVALLPQGGNTGLVGGGVPLHGEIVVSLRRLDDIEIFDTAAQSLVGAGVTLGNLQRAASQSGLAYGVDLASRDSATIGGTIATNAGGLRVLRYGDTRTQLVGIEAVLGDGSVVSHLAGLVRDNTGYHLPSLLCGSEGTLAVITRARVRLVPALPCRAVALIGLGSVAEVVTAAAYLRKTLPTLTAAELIVASGLELVCSTAQLRPPFRSTYEAYLLAEATSTASPVTDLAAAVSATPGVLDAAITDDARGCERLWAYRERHTEAINTLGPPHKLDVTLPLDQLADSTHRVSSILQRQYATSQVWIFGHVADGNVHVNVTGVDPNDENVDETILRCVAESGGSISAEHGIGTAKRRWLSLNRSAEEIAAFRRIKNALDPRGILNPYALLP